jgi:hypothetical protein
MAVNENILFLYSLYHLKVCFSKFLHGPTIPFVAECYFFYYLKVNDGTDSRCNVVENSKGVFTRIYVRRRFGSII